MKRPIIRLKPREGRRVRGGAPWVFSNEIVMDAGVKALPPGTLADLADEGGAILGTGYFNPKSLIAIRLFTREKADIEAGFFRERIGRAVRLRDRLFGSPFYRLVHAEADFLPGLVVDRFGDCCVVQITTAGMERLTDHILAALNETMAPKIIILRNDTPARNLEGLDSYVRVAQGEAPHRVAIEENGVTYFSDPLAGQKSGWYYDQRANRAFVADLAKGAEILDAYCYSGGFGVLTAARGAAHVTGLDSSELALQLAQEAAMANGVEGRCTFVKCDVHEEFERLAQKQKRFEFVICDPPPFAPSRKDLESAARAYRRLARQAAGLVTPGGFLALASCSHNISAERFGMECAAGISRAGRQAALIRESGAGPDHPVHPMLPETAYLKTFIYSLQ